MNKLKTWGEMSRDEKINFVVAWHVDGLDIHQSPDSKIWFDLSPTSPIYDHWYYRVKRTKPSIDWSHVSEEYNWMATDEDRETHLYIAKPIMGFEGCWLPCRSHGFIKAEQFTSLKPGTCHWKDSLVERPKE